MSMTLLSTKLQVPRAQRALVPRSRLLGRLDAGLGQEALAGKAGFARRLTLVSARAGSGKTTLLGEWCRGLERAPAGLPVAWLSLDEQDDDPVPFWTYVIAALQSVDAGLGQEALQLLQGGQPPPVQAVLTPLLNELAALDRGLVLVLDDYHLISSQAIHEGLAFFLDHQPPNVHLAIATRADPVLPVFRLRARGQLTELRSDDLRFTAAEAATFLNTTMGLRLGPEDVQALEARTEGWIVGLQLAGLALQGHAGQGAAEQATSARQDGAGVSEFLASFSGSHHYVLEYLTEEVMRRQPEPVRSFLIQTSILDRLCGPLCDALCADPAVVGGEAMLADLQGRNLFLIPLDNERRWYRYHHLFADLLANLLRREHSAAQIRALHHRASAWHQAHGAPEEAIQHALEAGDLETAGDLVAGAAQGLLAHGRLSTLLRWAEALPEDVLRARPHLRLYQGWALHLGGRSDEAERILQETKEALQAEPAGPEILALRGQVAALLTGIATLHQDPATVIHEGQEALAFLPEEDRVSRARTYIALGTAYAYDDQVDRAGRALRQARDLALQAGNPFLATAAIELLAGMQIYHLGRLHDGARTLQRVLDLGTAEDGTREPFTGTAHALLAEIRLEWNDLDAASRLLETGLALQARGGIGYGLIHSLCTKSRLRRALGDAEGALEAIETAEVALQKIPMWHMIVHHACCQVRLRLWLGDLAAASRWARGSAAAIQAALPEELPVYLRELQQISLARVHLAGGEATRALETLAGLEDQAQAAGRQAQVMEICLLQALALEARGQTGTALAALERSLSLAEPAGYVRLYLEGGPPVAALLRQAVQRGTRTRYARRLLEAMGEPGAGPALLPEPLTRRELEVLDLIDRGYSNRQIAEELVVSLHTVKKHSSNLYGKLGVRGRTQAIVRARELGLLG